MVAALLPTAIGAVAGLFKSKPKPAPAPLPISGIRPRQSSLVSDALAARSGAAANRRTGAAGAESAAGPKKQLMGM